MHADSDGKLIRDSKQDCNGFYLDSNIQSIFLERSFDTCDSDNYVIEDGTVHVVWAHGDDKLFSSKGLCLTGTSSQKHGFIRVRLLTPPGLQKVNAQRLHITNNDLNVPGDDTTYWCKIIKLPEFITHKVHHIVQVLSTTSQIVENKFERHK